MAALVALIDNFVQMFYSGQIDIKLIGRHLLFWLFYLVYQMLHLLHDSGIYNDPLSINALPSLSVNIPVAMITVYTNLIILIPALYNKGKYVQYSIALLFLLVFHGFTERLFGWLIWPPLNELQHFNLTIPSIYWIPARMINSIVDIIPAVAITMVLSLMRNTNQYEKKFREMETESLSAKMALLKAELSPHFFLNTLNSLYELTLSGSKKSAEMVHCLTKLMQYILYDARAMKVLVQDEITQLENYINIGKLSFAERLNLSFEYSGDIECKMIVPLLLLPFIENAFKHGMGENSGCINIDLKVEGHRLFLKVENSYEPTLKPETDGPGLINVQKRLDLAYPDDYELNLEHYDGLYKVDLKIDL